MFGLALTLQAPWQLSSIPSSKAVPPLIPPSPPLHAHPRIRTYISDLLSATRQYPILHNYLITYRCNANHILAIAKLWVKLNDLLDRSPATSESPGLTYSDRGDIRPDDIRDIFASCVIHRLRYREERDRLSAVWDYKRGAATNNSGDGQITTDEDGSRERKTSAHKIETLPTFEAILAHIIAIV